MKTLHVFKFTLLLALATLFTARASSGLLHFETATFKVWGNCSMCKKTIEAALKKNESIKSADWNVETKMVTVVYDPHTISLNEVHQLIADAGYDTEKVKGSDAAYKKLPGCCQYERKK